jgi:hypothetical protein
MAKDEDDYAEVEVIDDDDEPRKKYQRKSKRRDVDEDDEDDEDDRPSRLKLVLAIICVIVIIAAIFLVYFFTMTPIKSIHLDPPQPYEDGIRVTCHVLMEGGSTTDGNGDVKIYYDDSQVYSGSIKINRDDGEAFIDYDQFVEGNGQYTVEVSYLGESVSQSFDLQESPFFQTIVENYEITAHPDPIAFNKTVNAVKLNVNVKIKDNSGNIPSTHCGKSQVTLKVQYETGNSQTFSEEVNEDFGVNFDEYNYLSTGAGNYTFSVTWENLYARSESKFREVELELKDYLNMPIYADAGEDYMEVEIGLLETEETVEFDASYSKNDGEIVIYQWDLDFKDDNNDKELDFTIDGTGRTISKTYTVADAGYTYEVALRIWGKGIINSDSSGPPEYEFSYYFMDVEVSRTVV